MNSQYGDLSKLSSDIQGKIVESDSALKDKELAVGTLGKFFGAADNSSRNVAGFVSVVALLTAVAVTLVTAYKTGVPNYDCWKIVVPLISGALGFMFGNSSKS